MKLMKWLSFFVPVLLCLLISINGQNLFSKLKLFDELEERVWYGHYSNPEDSHYVHKLKAENILNSNVIILSKEVEELNFQMKIFFHWNPELEQIGFQSITNKGQLSSGVVEVSEDKITLIGENIEKTKRRKFKQSFQLLESSKLEDRFYLMINEKYEQRHLIHYE